MSAAGKSIVAPSVLKTDDAAMAVCNAVMVAMFIM
jgi:hypothetical protein